MADLRTTVGICGAGPSGLALAVELGSRGIDCIVIERNDRVGYAPRAKTTHTRTREHFRRWGIAGKLAEAAPFGIDYPSDVHFVTRMAGYRLASIPDAFNCAPERNDLYSEHAQWIPQYRVEEVLRVHAASLPSVRLIFQQEYQSSSQHEGGVVCIVRDVTSGDTYQIECEYLVGADGARSSIREEIGAQMIGRYGLSHAYNIVFRAPGLAASHHHGPGIMYWLTNPQVPGAMGPMDRDDLWYFMPGRIEGVESIDLGMAADLIRQGTDIDLEYEVLSADEWVASELIADRYRHGRIFLIGDSCHLHPPTGGFGMNMGIGDSVDLGWKLAAVLSGWGGPVLLESYELERMPVHRQVIDAALSNFGTIGLHLEIPSWIEEHSARGASSRRELGRRLSEGRAQEFRSLGVMLGARYESSPIVAHEEAACASANSLSEYIPDARPGSRAPHKWLGDEQSLYDLLGTGFTLLSFAEDTAHDLRRAQNDADRLAIPLKVVSLEDKELARLYARPLCLIRPDQHVAWRGNSWVGESILLHAAGWSGQAAKTAADPISR